MTRHRYAAAALRGTTRARRIRADAADRLSRIRGRRDPTLPPRTLIETIGGGDYVAVGNRFFEVFKQAGLETTHDVLDVGCGVGRMARPLVGWLEGRYEGFDASAPAIRGATTRLAPSHSGFTHVDVANDLYNPRGQVNAEAGRVPLRGGLLRLRGLDQRFTHMQPAGVLREPR